MTVPQRDFYQVLGVPRDASPAQIRHAYVRHAKRHHPDLAPQGSLPGRLQEVQQAYRCLSNAEARARHDRMLQEREESHLAHQREVQRRLRRYDRRHPHWQLRPRRLLGWRPLLIVTVGTAVLRYLSRGAIG